MDAIDYLKRVNRICKTYEGRGLCNSKCPLKKYGCGTPMKSEDIEKVIELVEEQLNPFLTCNKCKKEIDIELLIKYDISHCPWCGEPITK
jgi:hypothetical protein